MKRSARVGMVLFLIGLSLWVQRQAWLWFIAYPLILMSTVPHELGHGLAALMMGERFISLEMQPDGSGVAMHTVSGGHLSQAFIAAAGLVGPALTAALAFLLAEKPRSARFGLLASGVVCLLLVVTVVKNLFALLFIGALGLLLLLLGRFAPPRAAQWTLAFLAVQLGLSVFSRSDYLFTRSAGMMPSDVEHIAQNLFLPYWFWGALCGLFSVVVLVVGLRGLLTDDESPEGD